MPRAKRAKASRKEDASKDTTTTATSTTPSKTSRDRHNAQRRKLYKKSRRAQQVQALQAALHAADPARRRELAALRGQVYRPWKAAQGGASDGQKTREQVRVAELERLVREQREQIQALRRTLLQAGGPGAETTAMETETVTETETADADADADADLESLPVRIREQLLNDASSPLPPLVPLVGEREGEQQQPAAAVEIEEVVETTVADDAAQSVEAVTAVASSIEKDVDYPTLPSVEGEGVVVEEEVQQTIEADDSAAAQQQQEQQQQAQQEQQQQQQQRQQQPELEPAAAGIPALSHRHGTPLKAREVLSARDSSAEDSSAGTPRNVRRSPRKRTVKRRSFAGQSYA